MSWRSLPGTIASAERSAPVYIYVYDRYDRLAEKPARNVVEKPPRNHRVRGKVNIHNAI